MKLEQVEAVARRLPLLAEAHEIEISLLAGGITNHNYLLRADGETLVMRVSGEKTDLLGITRTREAHNHCVAACAGIAPDAIGFIIPEGYLVTRFVEGTKISFDDMRQPARIAAICRSLHAIHDGPGFLGEFSPFRAGKNYLSVASAHGAELPKSISRALVVSEQIEGALYENHPPQSCPIHSDLLNENLIDDGQAIRILDWEYSGMGDIFFDLGNLADQHEYSADDEETLLKAYFGQFDAGQVARLKLMRIMSSFREATWGIAQGVISALDFDFSDYASKFLLRMERLTGDEDYGTWLHNAGEVG